MKSRRLMTFAALAAVFLAAPSVYGQDRPRIAVIPFDNRTDWWAQDMGDVAADMIATRLVNSGQFTVIESQRLDAILAEQGFQLSGQVSPDDVVRIGKVAGVTYIITGSVTRFSIDEIGTRVLGRNVGYTEAQSEMNVRVISTETGEIVTAAAASGSKRLANVRDVLSMSTMDRGVAEDALSPAADDIAEELVKHRASFVMIQVEAPAMPAPSADSLRTVE